ncbi:16S rRNA (guanine(527)-N(7))-methyltransferase RsmG [Nocardia sp. 2YAB30]|uniref:16S rRNA (guanine(527)-N(7))-methyltransferase RsmG n=1 Tax=unclassified Nocardia TaxID=2637762 RepID=UPI003F96FADD
MFHVERDLGGTTAVPTELEPPAPAATVFGDRLDLARRYCAALATAGVERGLIGPREVPRLWDRHILNCAVLGELIAEGASVVDIGSGAGLPGIPLAIARPDLRITLVEPLLRRTIFLSEFIESAGLDMTVVRGRAEQSGVMKEAGGADVVTSRAVAPLGKLAQWSLPLLRDHGHMLALKGASASEELERDGQALARAGAGNAIVLECGVGLVSTPTMVISAERLPRAERSSRRRAERKVERRAKGASRSGTDERGRAMRAARKAK